MRVIKLVGIGMYPRRDLTLDARDAIRSSKLVLFSGVPAIRPWLVGLGVRFIRDISAHCVEGDTALVDAVLDASHEYGNVTYIVVGKPNPGAAVIQKFRDLAAKEDDLAVEWISGVQHVGSASSAAES
jgi:diphthamide biosynthesis methyltransferase